MPSIVTPPTLTNRAIKGSPLSSAEIDENFDNTAAAILALGESLGLYLDTDLTWKPKVIPGSAIKDREITEAKLSPTANFFKDDTGAANAYAVTFLPAITSLTKGFGFWMMAANSNTGPSTIDVDGITKDIKTSRGFDITADDIQAGRFHKLIYDGSFFVLVNTPKDPAVTVNTTVSTVNIRDFESTEEDFPGANTAFDFVHGLEQVPDFVQVVLVCKSDELGFVVGDEVEVANFIDTSKEPAFSVVRDNSKISVVQNASTVQVQNLASGTATTIDNAKWKIKARAKVLENTVNFIPPAPEFMVANPGTAFFYDNEVWVYQHDRFTGGYASRCVRHSLSDNNVSLVHTITGVQCIGQLFKFTAGAVKFVACDSSAIFMQDLDTAPHSRVVLNATNLSFHRPIYVDDSSDPDHPDIYFAKNYPHGSGDLTNAVTFKKMIYSGSYSITDAPANLNFHNALIANVSAFNSLVTTASTVNLVQVNPIKRRIYLVEASSGFIHIFSYSATYADFKDFMEETDAGARHAELTYVKTIMMPSGGGLFATGIDERQTICWDMTTGAENYIVQTRRNNVNLYGSFVLGNWREG